MEYIIDRFEGNYAVCENEDKKMINIERTEIPLRAKEGTKIKDFEKGYIIVDNSEDKKRIEEKMAALLKK